MAEESTKCLPISVCVPISASRWTVFGELCFPSIVKNSPAEIIIEDGSSEGAIVVEHDKCHPGDVRVQCLTRSVAALKAANEGIGGTTLNGNTKRNRAASHATQPFLFFCDDDIILDPYCLPTLLTVLQRHPDASYAYCDYLIVGHPTRAMDIHHARAFKDEALHWRNFISTMSLIRTAHFPGFDESIARFQDYDLWLTMLANGHRGQWYSERPLFAALYTNDVISGDYGREFQAALDIVHKKHGIPPGGR